MSIQKDRFRREDPPTTSDVSSGLAKSYDIDVCKPKPAHPFRYVQMHAIYAIHHFFRRSQFWTLSPSRPSMLQCLQHQWFGSPDGKPWDMGLQEDCRWGPNLREESVFFFHGGNMEVSWNRGTPSHHPFNGIFPYKPSILRYPHFMETPIWGIWFLSNAIISVTAHRSQHVGCIPQVRCWTREA